MRRVLPLTFLLILALPLRADQTGPPQGFTALFDGKTLDGWKMVNTQDNFLVKNGVLVMDRGKGWLATEKAFGDFELRIRYRFVTPGADSGVFIRSSLEGKNWTSRGYQIQNMDNETLGRVIGMGVKIPKEDQRYDADRVRSLKKPAGHWQDLVIRASGKSVSVSLNGDNVASADNTELLDGHIGLQAEGGVLEFQRIDIKPL
jgi:hypothetical protein